MKPTIKNPKEGQVSDDKQTVFTNGKWIPTHVWFNRHVTNPERKNAQDDIRIWRIS